MDNQSPAGDIDDAIQSHPAHIHAGSCNALGELVSRLEDVATPANTEREGAATAHNVKLSLTNVDIPLQALIGDGFAIVVHQSEAGGETAIACGDIGGYVVVDPAGHTELFFGLQEQNASGHTGVVRLGIGDDPDQTEVSIMVIEPEGMR
jgi:hypothetical protein